MLIACQALGTKLIACLFARVFAQSRCFSLKRAVENAKRTKEEQEMDILDRKEEMEFHKVKKSTNLN